MRLGWIDLETTGLDPVQGNILEASFLITEHDLTIIPETQVSFSVLYEKPQLDFMVKKMDDYVRKMHTENGLIDQLYSGDNCKTLAEIESIIIATMSKFETYNSKYRSPLCGNSVHFDRMWMNYHMKDLINCFSYRNIDVSTVQELCQRLFNLEPLVKNSKHRALSDIKASIEQLINLKTNYFRVGTQMVSE